MGHHLSSSSRSGVEEVAGSDASIIANPSEEDVADFRPSGPGQCQRSKSTQFPGGTYLSRSVARLGLDCV